MTVGAIARLDLTEVERSRPDGRALGADGRYVAWRAEPLRQLDFVIDGVSTLQRAIAVALPAQNGLREDQFVSVVDLTWPNDAASSLRWLLGRSRRDADWDVLEPGRLPIYVCARCGDVYCGALTVAVDRLVDPASRREMVRWAHLRLEDAHTPPSDMPDLSRVGTFLFDAEQYDAQLGASLDGLDRLTQAQEEAERAWKEKHGFRAWTRRALRRSI